jgi:hypothetical protein
MELPQTPPDLADAIIERSVGLVYETELLNQNHNKDTNPSRLLILLISTDPTEGGKGKSSDECQTKGGGVDYFNNCGSSRVIDSAAEAGVCTQTMVLDYHILESPNKVVIQEKDDGGDHTVHFESQKTRISIGKCFPFACIKLFAQLYTKK